MLCKSQPLNFISSDVSFFILIIFFLTITILYYIFRLDKNQFLYFQNKIMLEQYQVLIFI